MISTEINYYDLPPSSYIHSCLVNDAVTGSMEAKASLFEYKLRHEKNNLMEHEYPEANNCSWFILDSIIQMQSRWKRNIVTSVSLILIAKKKKGIGNFCAHYPNSDNKHGWCFASITEAEYFFKIAAAKYKFRKDILKMQPIMA